MPLTEDALESLFERLDLNDNDEIEYEYVFILFIIFLLSKIIKDQGKT